MPLPHFLLMLCAVLLAAAITLWVAIAAGIPFAVLGIVAAGLAVVLHLAAPADDSGDETTPNSGA